MPRKAGRESGRETVETEVEVPGEVHVSDQQQETYERIEFLKEKFGDDATGRASIQRRLKDGRLIGLPSIPALTFDTDLVAKRYGGGRYYVRFYQGRQYLGDLEFELDEALKPEPEQPREVVAVTTGGEAPSWLAATLDKMGDAIRALAERPAPAPPAAPDPMAMIKAIGETMKSLTPAAPPLPPAAPGLAEQLALVESVVSVGTKIIDARGGGDGSSGDAYMGAVEKLAEPITELVRLRVQQEADRRALNPPRGRRALPPPARNAVTPPAAAPAAASGGQPMGASWLVEIQRWVPMMVKRARANRSAEDTAFFILDELSEPTLQELAKLAAMPDFGAQVARVLPAELGNYPEWTTEFLAAVQDWLFGGDEGPTAEGDDEPEEPDEGGDSEPEAEEVTEAPVFDLEAEAKRRLALLKDAPPKEPAKEPVTTS